MSDPSLLLQAALITKLKANSGVAAKVATRVYDVPPNEPVTYPYITLGADQVLPDKADCIDGVEIFSTIDAWSRGVGFPEVKQIGAAIVAALDDQPPVVSGYTVVVLELDSLNYLRDPDGLTHHASITFRSLIQLA